jgi:signal-transduction protein with cAMP-binding, CBS, and nucleotidyltransferase domain
MKRSTRIASACLALAVLAGCVCCPLRKTPPNREVLEAVAQVPLFRGLSAKELSQVAGVCAFKECRSGDYLIHQEGQCDYMYVLRDGKADVRVSGATVATLEKDALIGEMSFVDQRPSVADVVMVTDSKLIQIEKAGLTRLMDSKPRLGLTVMRNIAEALSLKLGATNRRR